MSKFFEIKGGALRGKATAVVEVSFELPLYELRLVYEGEADTPEEFLDALHEDFHADVAQHIEIAMGILGYECESLPDVNLLEVDVEVEEVEDDEDE